MWLMCCCGPKISPVCTIARWSASGSLVYAGMAGDRDPNEGANAGVCIDEAVNASTGELFCVHVHYPAPFTSRKMLSYHAANGSLIWSNPLSYYSWAENELDTRRYRIAAGADACYVVRENVGGTATNDRLTKLDGDGEIVWDVSLTVTDWYSIGSGSVTVSQVDVVGGDIRVFGGARGPSGGNWYVGASFDSSGNYIESLTHPAGSYLLFPAGVDANPGSSRFLYHSDGSYSLFKRPGTFGLSNLLAKFDSDLEEEWVTSPDDPLSLGFEIVQRDNANDVLTGAAIANTSNDMYLSWAIGGFSATQQGAFLIDGSDGTKKSDIDEVETEDGTHSVNLNRPIFTLKGKPGGGNLVWGIGQFGDYGNPPNYDREGNISVTTEGDSAVTSFHFGSPTANPAHRFVGVADNDTVWATAGQHVETDSWT